MEIYTDDLGSRFRSHKCWVFWCNFLSNSLVIPVLFLLGVLVGLGAGVGFATFLQKTILELSFPISVAIYFDEVLPGNPGKKGLNQGQRTRRSIGGSFSNESLWFHDGLR